MINTRTEYLEQLKTVIQEYKKLKGIKKLNGDLDNLDEVRKINYILNSLSYDWNIGAAIILKCWGYYIIHSDDTATKKENVWNVLSNFLLTLMKLQSHSDYTQSSQIFFEELLTAIENKEIEI